MVQLTGACYSMRTFGLRMKKYYNRRVPIQYKKFAKTINPDELVEYYSRDDIDSINRREGQRTFRDAQLTMGRKNFLLPNLSDQDLELNDIFQKEKDRQRAIVARVDKIRVLVDSNPGKDTELIMNREISTPYDCARHIHEMLTTRSVVAEILPLQSDHSESTPPTHEGNSDRLSSGDEHSASSSSTEVATTSKKVTQTKYWDMHRPLEEECRIRFRHFTDSDLSEINKIYWRSCSFIMGMAIRLAFKDNVKVLLHSWPRPNIKSGSFVYDVALSLSEKWVPDEQELRAFTKVMWDIKKAALPFDRLQVDREVARKLFAHNPFKLAQIDSIVQQETPSQTNNKVTIYRCGGLLDISVGPMISNTSQIGRISLAAVHPFESESDRLKGVFYRFQGVSLPQQLPVSSFLYQNIIMNRAKELNRIAL